MQEWMIVVGCSLGFAVVMWLIFGWPKRERWMIDRVARWSLNNGITGEWSIGDLDDRAAFNYVRKRLITEGTVDRNGLDWLNVTIVEHWIDS